MNISLINQLGVNSSNELSVLREFVETTIAYWISAILCPIFALGVIGNLYAALALLFIRKIQKNPAILTIILIGLY